MTQAGTVYRYFRVDSDHDISADPLELSLNGDLGPWVSTGIVYIPSGSLPSSCQAADVEHPPADGYAGYWWRVLTGPLTDMVMVRGTNIVRGQLADSPETPHFEWSVTVGTFE